MYIDSIIYVFYLINFNKIIKIKCMKLINLYNYILNKLKVKCYWRGEGYVYYIMVILYVFTFIDLDIFFEGF